MYEVIWSVTYGTNKKIINLKIDDIYMLKTIGKIITPHNKKVVHAAVSSI